MKPTQRESLSALADGALDADALRFLLRRLDNDPASLQAWARYHLVGDALRGECGLMASEGFATRVRVELDEQATAPGRRHRWLQWSGGGVIAAGVAAVALMAVQPHGLAPTTTAPAGIAATVNAQAAANDQTSIAPRVQHPSSPAQVPRWLSASSATQMTQPAAATFYGFGHGVNTLAPATYSRRMAPYMHIRAARSDADAMQGHPGVRYVLLPPHAQAAGGSMRSATTR